MIGLTVIGLLIDGLFINLRCKWRWLKIWGDSASKNRYWVSLQGHDSFIFQGMPNLLDALKMQAVEIHGKCMRGYCGACKLTVLYGEVRWIMPPDSRLKENEILACCCVPQSDLQLSGIES